MEKFPGPPDDGGSTEDMFAATPSEDLGFYLSFFRELEYNFDFSNINVAY